jgi:hypothetical protein
VNAVFCFMVWVWFVGDEDVELWILLGWPVGQSAYK